MIHLDLIKTSENLQYHVLAAIDKRIFTSVLIDTGASVSHIHPDFVNITYKAPEIVIDTMTGEKRYSTKTTIEVIFHEDLKFKLDIYIDDTDVGAKLLLGMDFLEKVDFEIKSKEIIINKQEIPRIKLPCYEIERQL